MQLNVNDEQLRTLVSAALLQTIDTTGRDKLLQDAITYLLSRDTRDRFSSETYLSSAFKSAISVVAVDIIRELLTTDAELKAKVRQVVETAFEAAITSPNMQQRLATAFAAALVGGDRDR